MLLGMICSSLHSLTMANRCTQSNAMATSISAFAGCYHHQRYHSQLLLLKFQYVQLSRAKLGSMKTLLDKLNG